MNESFAYGYPPPDDKDRLIRSHLHLVNFLSDRMATQVPAYMTRDDIVSAAMLGLVDAASRFDPGKGILFKTFAEVRIRGAIFDEVRRLDWFSRSMREKQGRVADAVETLEKRLGRSPEEEEIAREMGVGLEEYRQVLGEISHLGCISLNETIDDVENDHELMENLEDKEGKSPAEYYEAKELTRELAEHIGRLSEKERLVVSLYYYEELTQKEIAEVLRLSEGRVSQLHSQALVKLKVSLERGSRKSPAGRGGR